MFNILISPAGCGLLRALLDRAGNQRDRILLSEIQSVDWQSLTLAGERHVITLRIPGPEAQRLADIFVDGIEDAQFAIPGFILADIALARTPVLAPDQSITVEIEALTVLE